MDPVSYILSGLVSFILLLMGWQRSSYLARWAVAEKDASDLRTKIGALEVTCATLTAQHFGHAESMRDLKEKISDICDNMVRRADLDALDRRIDDAIRSK